MIQYDKYDKHGALHWEWFEHNTHGYRGLVDDSIRPFVQVGNQENQTVVDVGCGDCLPATALRNRGYIVTGVEPDRTAARLAKEKGFFGKIIAATAEQFADMQMKYDCLFSLNTIEHLDDPGALVRIMRRIRKFGVIVTDVPGTSPSKYHTHEMPENEFRHLFAEFDLEPLAIRHPEYYGFIIRPKNDIR